MIPEKDILKFQDKLMQGQDIIIILIVGFKNFNLSAIQEKVIQ